MIRSPASLKAFALARELGLTRDDRVDFARMLLADDEIRSWSDLHDQQISRIVDGLEGFLFVTHLRATRDFPGK